jgi:hypothetical protein
MVMANLVRRLVEPGFPVILVAACPHHNVTWPSPAALDFPGQVADARCSTSLSGDATAALREHGPATLDEHCWYFGRSD